MIVPPANKVDRFSLVQRNCNILSKKHKCLSCDKFNSDAKVYQIDIKSIIRSFDYGRLLKKDNSLTSLNSMNYGRFLQNPEEILLLEKEEKHCKEAKTFSFNNNEEEPNQQDGFKLFQ